MTTRISKALRLFSIKSCAASLNGSYALPVQSIHLNTRALRGAERRAEGTEGPMPDAAVSADMAGAAGAVEVATRAALDPAALPSDTSPRSTSSLSMGEPLFCMA